MPPAVNATAGTILGFLHDGPATGWDLQQRMARSVGNFWNTTRSQVYRELGALERDGLVERDGEPGPHDRSPFRLTRPGRAVFRRWVARDLDAEPRRVPVLLATFFADHLPPGRLAELLDDHRAEIEAELAVYLDVKEAGVLAGAPAIAATLEYGIRNAEMVIAWIDDVARPLID